MLLLAALAAFAGGVVRVVEHGAAAEANGGKPVEPLRPASTAFEFESRRVAEADGEVEGRAVNSVQAQARRYITSSDSLAGMAGQPRSYDDILDWDLIRTADSGSGSKSNPGDAD